MLHVCFLFISLGIFCTCYLWLSLRVAWGRSCRHSPAPLPSLETLSESSCSRRCSQIWGLCIIDVTGIFDVGPCSKFDFGFLPLSLILDCHNLYNWVGSDFALRSALTCPFDFGWADLLQTSFWIWSIFDFGPQKSNTEWERQGEEEREGEGSIIVM